MLYQVYIQQELPLRTVAVPCIRQLLWREANEVVPGVHAPGTSAAESRCTGYPSATLAGGKRRCTRCKYTRNFRYGLSLYQVSICNLWREANVVLGVHAPGTSSANSRCTRYPSATLAGG
jgi:hypothetical protein